MNFVTDIAKNTEIRRLSEWDDTKVLFRNFIIRNGICSQQFYNIESVFLVAFKSCNTAGGKILLQQFAVVILMIFRLKTICL